MTQKTTKESFKVGNKFHVDMPFENERLVDTIEIIKEPEKHTGDVMAYSPYLHANIFIPVKELKPIPDSKGLHTQGEWAVLNGNKYPIEYRIYSKPSGWHIATLNPFSPEQENAKANAELIVKAVNERQDLEYFLNDLLRIKAKTDQEFDEAQGLFWKDKIRHLIGM